MRRGAMHVCISRVPGLRTRNASTTVQMREGQTLAIAGSACRPTCVTRRVDPCRRSKPVAAVAAVNRYVAEDALELIDVEYELLGNNEVGFSVGNYDRSHQLVIDPTLTWNTFLGAGGDDQAKAMAVIGDVEGKVAIILDDMVDTAGTLTEAAEAATRVHRDAAADGGVAVAQGQLVEADQGVYGAGVGLGVAGAEDFFDFAVAHVCSSPESLRQPARPLRAAGLIRLRRTLCARHRPLHNSSIKRQFLADV